MDFFGSVCAFLFLMQLTELKGRTKAEEGGGHVLLRAQTPRHHPAAQRSVTNKSLQVQESGDSVLRSLSHE